MILATRRLILRQWRDEDYFTYAALNADPEAMRYFPCTLTAEQSVEQAEKLKRRIAAKGWGFWAVELKSSAEFIGFTGLGEVDAKSGIPHAPMTEAGWRLLPAHWGKGYATEGAQRAIRFAFEQLGISEVYSFTAVVNKPSQRVMVKAGMTDTGENFDHPALAPDDELVRHCLYRISRKEWLTR